MAILLIAAGLLLGYGVLWARVPCGFAYTSYCTDCGMIENVNKRQLPIFGLTIHTSRSERATLLSSTLARRGVREGHAHHWVFGAGGDYGLVRSCALGGGRSLGGVVDDPDVAVFVDGLCQHADPATRDQWLNLLLDPCLAGHALQAVESAAPPPSGFKDAASFKKWWGRNAAELDGTAKVLRRFLGR